MIDKQDQLIAETQTNLEESQSMEDYFAGKMAAAETDEDIQDIENEKIARGYTDPDKLQEVGDKLQQDRETLSTAYITAQANAVPPATLDFADLPPTTQAAESFIATNVSNEDYKQLESSINSTNVNNWPKDTYVA